MHPKLVFQDGQHRLVFPNGREMIADFARDPRYQRKLRGRQELIAKAVGLKPGFSPRVWDLSLGLGEDAWTLVRLGCEVTGYERQNLLVQWLQSSFENFCSRLEDSERPEWAQRFRIRMGEAETVLQSILPIETSPPDVLYFDPMYSDTSRKSALPRIEMQMLRAWLGEDKDQGRILQLAREQKRVRRIVVKRPHRAPELAPGVNHRFEGEKVRYDMYLTNP